MLIYYFTNDSRFGSIPVLSYLSQDFIGIGRANYRYQFTFEAVVLYLIRWDIVLRWTSRDAAAGQEKFEALVAEAMGRYADMFKT